ncbi:hypothetical protein [Deinococcus taeanensis]|uniref:hypothetical protein n=1 Tax=Deinococcus taeanensis TaxID=2737050 RepID=UPI003D818B50
MTLSKGGRNGGPRVTVDVRDSGVQGQEFLSSFPSFDVFRWGWTAPDRLSQSAKTPSTRLMKNFDVLPTLEADARLNLIPPVFQA